MFGNKTGRRTDAFTLVELIVVILIMGILVAVAAPVYSRSLSRYQAKAAIKRIASDLSYARQSAMNLGTSQAVEFSISTNSYSMPHAPNPNSSAIGYSVDLDSSSYPVAIATVDFGGTASVTFDMYGQPNTAGNIKVESGGFQEGVVLDAVTGLVEIQ